jgi:hypothetical protein
LWICLKEGRSTRVRRHRGDERKEFLVRESIATRVLLAAHGCDIVSRAIFGSTKR